MPVCTKLVGGEGIPTSQDGGNPAQWHIVHEEPPEKWNVSFQTEKGAVSFQAKKGKKNGGKVQLE
jgi:hypothetical protein